MEEESTTQSLDTHSEEEEYDNEFYEKIEAPKYVDLTAPDRFHPGDDRYWFCSRVGCDQRHEEELDHEAISKNFVLRVMAARSPNIRLRRALYRKDSSAEKKCPQTVPPKPSKPRVSRLALISSMSKRMVDPKLKVKPHSKQNVTPNVKALQSSAVVKALTTPRNQKRLSNPNVFRSVRNPKATAIAVPKNRVVAKALFLSPKKSARVKTALELNNPVKTLCAEMKKLEITDGRKTASQCNRQLPSNASRKQPRGREVKSRVYDRLLSKNGKGKNAKSDECLKKKDKEKNMQEHHDPSPQDELKNDSSGMGIDDNSKKDSPKTHLASKCDASNVDAELHISNGELGESKVEASMDPSRSDLNSQPNLQESGRAESSQAPSRESNETNEKNEEEVKSSSEKDTNETLESDSTGYNLTSDDKENDAEAMESDDKENASASDGNRKLYTNAGHLEKKVLGNHKTPKGTQKMSRALDKPSKDRCTAGTQGIKHAKPKATNPKPFRLRTDERRILKEANSEKKVHVAPLEDITSAPGLPRERLQKKHQITSQRKEKCPEQTKYEGNEKRINRLKRDRTNHIDSSTLKIQKERGGRKFCTIPQRHTVSSQQKLVAPRQENSADNAAKQFSRRTKSPSVRQSVNSQELAPSTTEKVSAMIHGQLCVIKENSPTISRPKEPAKPSEVGASPQAKACASAVSRPSLQGKRLTTIPKEPCFHTVHVPKSCTRRVA
ncbi:hypothetical protein Tsubulata_027455 [Turnera subulata]|uniref:Uncharacterized protein n=1 Tax=Turnera subulata TaxID=218843 RepID=A0A9Q0FNI8_9ROSI|nr:hypothetical protein Tsubulata_027455 [Turnera subulata]